jgi:hypothetical protein
MQRGGVTTSLLVCDTYNINWQGECLVFCDRGAPASLVCYHNHSMAPRPTGAVSGQFANWSLLVADGHLVGVG